MPIHNNYLFNFRTKTHLYKKNIIKINNYTKPTEYIVGPQGPPGPPGLDGDRFATKTPYPLLLRPGNNVTLIFKVEPGLAYISGNSIIVSEVGDDINSELNTFEGTIQFYSAKSGEIVVKDIVNIKGEFGIRQCYYNVNLDGVDGAMGPPGPSCISDKCIELFLDNNILNIPYQENPISHYFVLIDNNTEIHNINCNLTSNQQAIILIKLKNLENNAIIFPINDINTNYNENIILNINKPYAIITLNKICDEIFCNCDSYYRNMFNLKV